VRVHFDAATPSGHLVLALSTLSCKVIAAWFAEGKQWLSNRFIGATVIWFGWWNSPKKHDLHSRYHLHAKYFIV